MCKRPDVYVCSKPLQYFNIKNIPDVVPVIRKKILLMTNSFFGAVDFVKNIRAYDNEWDEVLFLNDHNKLLKWLLINPIHYLFIDNDLSWLVNGLCMINRIEKMYAYEEGIGSYSTRQAYESAVSKGGFLRSLFRRMFGLGFHPGDSRFCSGIFLTKPYFYNRKFRTDKGLSFRVSFREHLQMNEAFFAKISGGIPQEIDVSRKRILLYVTEWEIKSETLEMLNDNISKYDLCLIKPHPQIKKIDIVETEIVRVLKTSVMCELIISYLLKRDNQLTIWHHYSTSVVHYIDSIESVAFPVNPEYERIYYEYVNA